MQKQLSLAIIIGGVGVLLLVMLLSQKNGIKATSVSIDDPTFNSFDITTDSPPDFVSEEATNDSSDSSDTRETLPAATDQYGVEKYILKHTAAPFITGYTFYKNRVSEIRVYPKQYSDEEIINDLNNFSNTSPERYFGYLLPAIGAEENFLTHNIVENLSFSEGWIDVSSACREYLQGDKCVVSIKEDNPFNLTAATLSNETGPYQWGTMTLAELYVLDNKNLLAVWRFGDGGVGVRVNTIWNTERNTLIKLSAITESMGVLVNLSVGSDNDKYFKKNDFDSVEVPETNIQRAIDLEKTPQEIQNIIKDLPESVRSSCKVNFGVVGSQNRADVTAEWVVKSDFSCVSNRVLMSQFYTWNPLTDEMVRVGEWVPY